MAVAEPPPVAAAPERPRADVVRGIPASAVLLAMMVLTVIDVIARYVFSRPVRGAFEVTELMLVVLIFAGLPLVSFAEEHAVMDFVDRVTGPRTRHGLRRVVELLNAGFMGALAWLVWRKADRISQYGDSTDVLRILYGPFVYFMALALALAAALHLSKVVERR